MHRKELPFTTLRPHAEINGHFALYLSVASSQSDTDIYANLRRRREWRSSVPLQWSSSCFASRPRCRTILRLVTTVPSFIRGANRTRRTVRARDRTMAHKQPISKRAQHHTRNRKQRFRLSEYSRNHSSTPPVQLYPARNTVPFGTTHPSRLVVPVIPK